MLRMTATIRASFSCRGRMTQGYWWGSRVIRVVVGWESTDYLPAPGWDPMSLLATGGGRAFPPGQGTPVNGQTKPKPSQETHPSSLLERYMVYKTKLASTIMAERTVRLSSSGCRIDVFSLIFFPFLASIGLENLQHPRAFGLNAQNRTTTAT